MNSQLIVGFVETAFRARCFWVESERDSRISEILIQPVGFRGGQQEMAKPWPEYSDPEARPGRLDYDRHTASIASKKRVVLQLDDEPKRNADGKTIPMRKAY